MSHYRKSDWDDWLRAQGLSDRAQGADRMVFDSSVLTWQAALDGLGMAIGQKALLRAELASGQLVCPFKRPLLRDRGHYLVRPRIERESRRVSAFRDWLMQAVAHEGRLTPA